MWESLICQRATNHDRGDMSGTLSSLDVTILAFSWRRGHVPLFFFLKIYTRLSPLISLTSLHYFKTSTEMTKQSRLIHLTLTLQSTVSKLHGI